MKTMIGKRSIDEMNSALSQYGMFIAKNKQQQIVFEDNAFVIFEVGSKIPIVLYDDTNRAKTLDQSGIISWTGLDLTSITDIKLPRNVISVDPHTFDGMVNLSSLAFPYTTSVKTIEDDTFNDCYQLKELKIGYGTTKIGARAFQHAVNLQKLYLPETLKSIGQDALGTTGEYEPNKLTFDFTMPYSYYTGNESDDNIVQDVEDENGSIGDEDLMGVMRKYARQYSTMTVKGKSGRTFTVIEYAITSYDTYNKSNTSLLGNNFDNYNEYYDGTGTLKDGGPTLIINEYNGIGYLKRYDTYKVVAYKSGVQRKGMRHYPKNGDDPYDSCQFYPFTFKTTVKVSDTYQCWIMEILDESFNDPEPTMEKYGYKDDKTPWNEQQYREKHTAWETKRDQHRSYVQYLKSKVQQFKKTKEEEQLKLLDELDTKLRAKIDYYQALTKYVGYGNAGSCHPKPTQNVQNPYGFANPDGND